MLKKIKAVKKDIKKGLEETADRKKKFADWEAAGSPGMKKNK